MAGIGIKLQELLKKETYGAAVLAYFYSTFAVAGQWIIVIISLALIFTFAIPILSSAEQVLFQTTIVYSFAFSLILTSTFQVIITRFVADKLYIREPQSILSALVEVITIIVPLSFFIATGFYFFFDIEVPYKLSAIILFIILSCLWILFSFLGSVRDYQNIGWGVLVGNIISFGAAILLGEHLRLIGYLAGYTLGQVILFFFLLYVMFREFSFTRTITWEFIPYFCRYWRLAVTFLIYNIAIWADRFVFWYSPSGYNVWSLFRAYYAYDLPIFLAYLTIIPSLIIFFLKIETDFYQKYSDYFTTIVRCHPTLEELEEKIKLMRRSLVEKMASLLKVQGLITVLCILYAPHILRGLGADMLLVEIFRFLLLGAFFHSLFFIIMILLWWFEYYRPAFCISFIFLITNGLFAMITVRMGFSWYGTGYLLATVISFIIAAVVFLRYLRQLNYFIFVPQTLARTKIPMPKRQAL